MTDISEFSTTELIEELAQRANDQIVLAFRSVSDGGETSTRFYTGNEHITNIGLAHALRIDIEHRYKESQWQENEED